MESTVPPLLALVHLVMLSMWGGVVATEAVVEILPFKVAGLHHPTIRFHYWIDLLVELPLVLAVLATGVSLVLTVESLTPLHLVKIGLGGLAVTVNLYCITVVVRRGRGLRNGRDETYLWRDSRRVLACFVVGLVAASGAVILGFRLALHRLA